MGQTFITVVNALKVFFAPFYGTNLYYCG